MKREYIEAKPFVKWVGGKTQLLNEIAKSLPRNLADIKDVCYVEPFVGGGAVLFWILQQYPNITRAVINDINAELICTYQIIKSDVHELICLLDNIQKEYYALDENDRKSYYLTKRALFNTKRNTPVQTAALFIFLNKTCFNGLYRVNSKGEFNVPHGRYTNPKICDANNLLAVHRLLQKVEIRCGDFAQTIEYASNKTLFYFDPPYKPLSKTSSFTSYSSQGFDDLEQIRLRDFCEAVSKQKSFFVASNSDPTNMDSSADFFDKLYLKFQIKRVAATRMINAVSSGRGKLNEVVISNC